VSARYIVFPKADRDLDDIADYLVEEADLETGLRFLTLADQTFALLATQPEMGWKSRLKHPELASMRVFRVSGFEKILIFYEPREEYIAIVRVLHGSRDLEGLFEKEGLP
jgi:toxin ParE1/3/4